MNESAPETASQTRASLFSDQEWAEVLDALDISPQQRRIVTLLFEGMGDKQIARHLEMAYPTLRTHIQRIFAHLNVHDRAELMLRVLREFRRGCGDCPRRQRRRRCQ